MKRTPVYAEHQAAGARFVDFTGWEMPVMYSSVIEEHRHVREHVGLFDVSHMGEIQFRGPQALEAANRLITNDISVLEDGRAAYSPMCLPDGGIVDDVIAYRFASDHVMFCVNASNVAKDFAWMRENSVDYDCSVEDDSANWAQIAVQGPKALTLLARLFGDEVAEMPPFHTRQVSHEGRSMLFATTGYTGERGGELYCATEDAAMIWRALLSQGEDLNARPIGLAARDTLRLEYKFCLYGNDIDETTNPIEALLGWTVKFSHDFIGRDVIEQAKADKPSRKLLGFKLTDKGIPRQGHPILSEDGETIGVVTSGTMSPSLNEAIGLGYIDVPHTKRGTTIKIDIRGRAKAAKIVKTPFIIKDSGK
jgi:aminomethyltransferase